MDVDRAIFSRVVANLLWNALQHAPADSKVRVEVGMASGGWLDFSVTNDGAPIPAEVQNSLFEAFVSGKPGVHSRYASGTGLGLTFCKLAMEVHGGCIRVESPIAGRSDGVRVTVSLPPGAVLRG
jgi:signal transduction histidine kinase